VTVHHVSFTLPERRGPNFRDVTAQANDAVAASGVRNGIVVVYSQHTTCSVLLQEFSHDADYWGTELLMQDLADVFEKVIPTCRTQGQYHHPGPKHIEFALGLGEQAAWSLNTDAHLRSVMLTRSQTVPVVDSAMVLGEFGRIYFVDWDHTRARQRTVHVQVVGE